jgi:O-antigen/teichoic acid export membrane protein
LRRRVWKFALTTWAAMLVSAVVWSRAEIFFLERYWGLHEVAMFTVGLTLATTVQQVANLFSGAFLPHFAGLAGAGERAVMQRQYAMATKLMALLVIPLSFGGAAVSPVLVPLLFGTEFAVTVPNAMVLMLTAGLSFCMIGSALVYAVERPDFIVIGGAVGVVLSVAAGILVVPRYGVWGAAWARLLIQSSMVGLGIWFINCRLHFSFPFGALARMLMAGLLCSVVAACVVHAVPYRFLALAIAVPSGAIVYFVGIRVCHALDADEAFQLSRLVNGLPAHLGRRFQSLVSWMASAA